MTTHYKCFARETFQLASLVISLTIKCSGCLRVLNLTLPYNPLGCYAINNPDTILPTLEVTTKEPQASPILITGASFSIEELLYSPLLLRYWGRSVGRDKKDKSI